ncbi:hypothetical protein Acsp01_61780 [Actinoplanes sp. NBRC 101535]|nr:hypothetical protein Acsp01_61780 [Actinoplanes sp. NBRC 101535]
MSVPSGSGREPTLGTEVMVPLLSGALGAAIAGMGWNMVAMAAATAAEYAIGRSHGCAKLVGLVDLVDLCRYALDMSSPSARAVTVASSP